MSSFGEDAPRSPTPGDHRGRTVRGGHVPIDGQGSHFVARHRSSVHVYAVIDDSRSPTFPLGDAIEVFVRREDAERFNRGRPGDEPELAAYLRIEERELEAGAMN